MKLLKILLLTIFVSIQAKELRKNQKKIQNFLK